MTENRPRGIYVAALTPVKQDLSPDTATFVAHCRWLLDQGADGLAVLGTTGEASAFSVTERLELLDALADAGISGGTLLPGTGNCAIPDTVALTRKALEVGAAGVVMLPPFYYKNVSDEGLYAAYDQVVQRVGDSRLKIYFYHFPQMSAVPISHDLIERLLKAYPDTIAGIKDSSGNLDNMLEMCRRFPGFGVFAGSEQFLLPVLRAGGAGCISATANVTITGCVDVYRNAGAADVDARQAALTAQRLAIQSKTLIPALKRIMGRATGDAAWATVRPPNVPLSEADAAALFAALDDTGFKLAA
ncbi:MAG: dihydrodipicolinate synthase family protein [Alphaproteobacteria bacterium]